MEDTMILDFIKNGGAVMWPLMILSFLSFLIIMDRIVVILFVNFSKKQNKPNILTFVRLLELIGQVAPALGFLGTVTGIIAAFKGISLSSLISLQDVSHGMYEALYTTAIGLVISITDYIAVQLFRWSAEKHENQSDKV